MKFIYVFVLHMMISTLMADSDFINFITQMTNMAIEHYKSDLGFKRAIDILADHKWDKQLVKIPEYAALKAYLGALGVSLKYVEKIYDVFAYIRQNHKHTKDVDAKPSMLNFVQNLLKKIPKDTYDKAVYYHLRELEKEINFCKNVDEVHLGLLLDMLGNEEIFVKLREELLPIGIDVNDTLYSIKSAVSQLCNAVLQ